jgi:cell division inhibitor SepF
MYVVEVGSFDKGAEAVADRFKRRQPVILNLQRADDDLSKRMVDFCAGLTYALDGEMHPIVDRLFLLTPSEVEVSSKESSRENRSTFFNRL